MKINTLTVMIDRMRIRARIGVPRKERVYTQTLEIDVSCTLRDLAIIDTDLGSTFDYSATRTEIIRLSERRRFRLLESLACAIARFVLKDRRVAETTITIKKPARFADCEAVGISATLKN